MFNNRLDRKAQTIFAFQCSDEQMCAFGTPNPQIEGDPIFTKDVEQIQTNIYERGWFPETLSGNIRPYAEDMNGLHYVHSYQLAYLLQQGIPEWNRDTPYFPNCICRVDITENNVTKPVLYMALQASGGSSDFKYPPDNPLFWTKFTTGADDYMPVGASLEWNSNTLPPNGKWLFEQGQWLPCSQYELLYSRLQNTFGFRRNNGVDEFRLPDSTGKFTVGFRSGNDPRGKLGSMGGSWDMSFTIPPHKHGIGNMRIVSSGGHTHLITDNGHTHGILLPNLMHQHTFRFGDYSASAPISGKDVVRRLVTLGSTGSGTDKDPTQVGWDAGTPNGAHTGHFRKMVSPPTPSGSMEPYGEFPPNRNLISASSQTNITIRSADHVHNSDSFVGSFGAASSSNNGDTGFQATSNLPPYIVKRKIIRVLP